MELKNLFYTLGMKLRGFEKLSQNIVFASFILVSIMIILYCLKFIDSLKIKIASAKKTALSILRLFINI